MFTEAVIRTWKGQIDVEYRANRMKMASDMTLEQIYVRLLKERARQLVEQEAEKNLEKPEEE